MIPGTEQASAQKPQLKSTLAVCAAKVTQSRLGATEVTNMEEVMQLFWKVQAIRYEPIFLEVGPGSLPKAEHRLRTMGNRMPPPRAVLDGVAGAIIRSVIAMV